MAKLGYGLVALSIFVSECVFCMLKWASKKINVLIYLCFKRRLKRVLVKIIEKKKPLYKQYFSLMYLKSNIKSLCSISFVGVFLVMFHRYVTLKLKLESCCSFFVQK